eukprot:COSAG01_NODE_24024_length_793_cov_1.397695_1_plen_32_part_10
MLTKLVWENMKTRCATSRQATRLGVKTDFVTV